MKRIPALAAAAAALLAVPAGAQERGWTSPEALAELAFEARDACSPPGAQAPETYILVSHAEWLAGLQGRPSPCPEGPALAVRIARAVAAARIPQSAGAHNLLARLHDRGIGVPADPAAARRHRQFEWLLTSARPAAAPFATVEEADRYLARPETIAFLAAHAGAPDMSHVRLRLARALIARGRRADRARIDSMLGAADLQTDTLASLMRARSAFRFAAAAAERDRAAASLRSLSRVPETADEARALLLPLVRQQLRSGRPDQRWQAIETLAAFAHLREPAALRDLQQAVRAANGGRSPPTLAGPAVEAIRQQLRAPMTGDDYPAAAIRAELQGRIALRGLIDPRGRLVYTEPLTHGQEPILLTATRNIYARRRLPLVDLGPLRTAPYMWIELPRVYYLLPEEE